MRRNVCRGRFAPPKTTSTLGIYPVKSWLSMTGVKTIPSKSAQICAMRSPVLQVLRNDRNRGKGFSVRHGILEASGPLILMMDADQSSPMEELDKLLPSVRDGQSDIAIGSRALKESQILVHQPLYREPLGFLYNDIIQLLVLKGIQDTQCGFKLFRREVARDVFSRGRLSGFAFDVEILFIARTIGLSHNRNSHPMAK